MWYQKILTPLTQKVIKADQARAQYFVENIFYQLSVITSYQIDPKNVQNRLHGILTPLPALTNEHGIPELLLLGLIDTMYKRFDGMEDGSVSLADFARHLLGLTLIFTKVSFDTAIWLEDFKFIWSSKKMIRYLGYTVNDFKIINRDILELEKTTFTDLNQSISIDYNNLLQIFSKKEFRQLLPHILDDLEHLLLLDDGELYTEFHNKIKDIMDFNSLLEVLPGKKVIRLIRALVTMPQNPNSALRTSGNFEHLLVLEREDKPTKLTLQEENLTWVEQDKIKSSSNRINSYAGNLRIFKLTVDSNKENHPLKSIVSEDQLTDDMLPGISN